MKVNPSSTSWKVVSALAGVLAVGSVMATSATASLRPHHTSATTYSTPFFHQIAAIAYPAPFVTTASDDISWVDSTLHGYYLADRTNGGIDMVNTMTDTFGGVLGGFAQSGSQTAAQKTACGTAIVGPNGVTSLTIHGVTQVWGGDGVTTANPVSSVKVFTMSSATTGTLSASINTGVPALGTTGTCRADEIAADPVDDMVIAANNADAPPYVSLISASTTPSQDAVVGQLKFPTATGIEQPLYDAKTKNFYVNVDNVGLVVINPKTKAVVHTWAEPDCTSTGLVLNPTTQQLLVACGLNPKGSLLMNALNGKVVTRFPQISGTDEEWYDPGMNLYFSASAKMTSNGNLNGGFVTPQIGVISGGGTTKDPTAHWIGAIMTGATANMKGVAVDAVNHEVFSPALGIGIIVFKNLHVFIGS
jgi:hypothetical protein